MGVVKAVAANVYALVLALGGPGLFLVAAADSSFLSVPEGNDLLIVVLSVGQSWSRMSYLVLMTIAGSTLGCSALYWVGRRGGNWYRTKNVKVLEAAEALCQRYGVGTILVASVLPPPAPFKIFVLSAGILRVSFLQFLMAVIAGRSVRYFTWGILAILFGRKIVQYMERNLAWTGLILLVVASMGLGGYFWFRNWSNRNVGEGV